MGQIACIVGRVPNSDDERERAIAAQFRAEISAADTNVKAVAKAVGIDYSALRRYLYLVEPHRSISLENMLAIAAHLKTPLSEIVQRGLERIGR